MSVIYELKDNGYGEWILILISTNDVQSQLDLDPIDNVIDKVIKNMEIIMTLNLFIYCDAGRTGLAIPPNVLLTAWRLLDLDDPPDITSAIKK